MLHISLVPWWLRALWHSVVVVLCLIEELRWDVCQWKNRRATCLWAHAEDLSIEALKKVTFVWHTKCITTCSACGAAGKTLLCSSARYCSVAKLHRALCADITTTEVVTVSRKEPHSLLVGKGFSSSQIWQRGSFSGKFNRHYWNFSFQQKLISDCMTVWQFQSWISSWTVLWTAQMSPLLDMFGSGCSCYNSRNGPARWFSSHEALWVEIIILTKCNSAGQNTFNQHRRGRRSRRSHWRWVKGATA